MNQLSRWQIGQVAPSKYDTFDPDFAMNKKFATNS